MPDIRLGRHARRWISVAVIVVVAGSGGATAWAMTGPSGPGYRTATVTRSDVTETLLSTGTIEPVSQANVSFPVSGQVASVSVSLGSHVTAGQVLARLSTTALASQVSSDQAAVASANVRLAADEASETTTTAYITTTTAYITSDPGGGGGTAGGTGSGGGSGTNPITAELRAIARDQAALLAAQHRLDNELAAARSLLAVETNLCTATSTPPPTPTPTTSPTGPTSPTPTASPSTPRSSPSPTPSPSTSRTSPTLAPGPPTSQSSPSPTWSKSPHPSYSAAPSHSATPSSSVTATTAILTAYVAPPPPGGPPGGPTPTTCQAAITELMSVQSGIAVDEQSLANSESALAKLLSQVAAAVEKSAGSGGSGSGNGGSTGGSGGSTGGGSGSTGGGSGGGRAGASGGGAAGATSSGPATAAQLAADQASLDSANAELSVARQDLAAASLTAPINGTVALVNLAPGQQVTGSQASGTTADFAVEGVGGEEATTTVSVSDVSEIRVGQPATVTLDGSATPLSGQVVAIGMLSSTSSSGTASYPVTIGLAAGAPTLFAGSDAQVAITLAKVSDAVSVPTSAVEGTGAASFVTVLRAGKLVRVRVVVGATGPVLTQVSSGLAVGERVVLADMGTPLPTNTNPFAARGLTTGGGGFGGGRTRTGTTGRAATTGTAG